MIRGIVGCLYFPLLFTSIHRLLLCDEVCYTWRVASPRHGNGKGVHGRMENITTTFLISVAAGIVSYYLCKWLDERLWRQQAWALSPARSMGIEKPSKSLSWRAFCMSEWYHHHIPATPSIAYSVVYSKLNPSDSRGLTVLDRGG